MKNKPSLIRLIRWQGQSFLLWRHLFLPLALFLLIGGYATSQTAQLSPAPASLSVWDVALVAFGGPGADDNSFVRMLAWFVPYLLFFYFMGDFAYGELAQRGYWVLPLVGSRFRWWISKAAKPVKTYSTGMRQRLAIAQAIMEKPRLLLLDEPTNGLDREGVQAIHELLLSLQTQGITILLASHNKEELETLCQTIVWMDRGQLMNGDEN